MKKSSAFTLAEVLLVMGIIGVVAAITVPTLSNSTNEKEIVAKVNKSAAMITDSYGRARAKYGRYPKNWDYTNNVSARIIENMQTTKICASMTSGCFVNNFKALNGLTGFHKSGSYGTSAILADGMSITYSNCIDQNQTCVSVSGAPTTVGYVIVDIDGPNKGFNTVGIDIFYFDLSPDGGLSTDDGSTMTALAEPVKLPHRTLASRMFEAPAFAIVGGIDSTNNGWVTGNNQYKLWRYTNYILANGNANYLKEYKN